MNFGPDYVRAIAPYQGGKPISEVAREFGLDEARIVKLASNENPLGIPESAKRAMSAAMADLARYPDSNGFDLKAAISEKFGVPAEWITLGNGSNDILELAARSLVSPGQRVVYSQYSFAVYPLATQAIGARAIVVAAKDFGHDLPAMLAAITDDTRLVFVANPNNPNRPPKQVGERMEYGGASMRAGDEMFQYILTFMDYQKGDEKISLESKTLIK